MMTKKIYKIFLILAIIFLANGCLKDKDYDDNWYGTKNDQNENFVEVALTNNDNNSNFYPISLSASNNDTTITEFIPVTLTSGPTSSDVIVTYELLDTTNSPIEDSLVNQLGYLVPNPASLITLNSNNQVVIKAGSSTGYISVKFKPNDLLGNTYAYGIQLTAVNNKAYTISNLNTGFVILSIRNMYDGHYTINGTMVDAANPVLTGAYPIDCDLITQTANSVAMFDNNIGGFYHSILNNGGLSYYGQFGVVFTFDANNNVVSVTNYYPNATNGRTAEIDPSGINKFDPSTNTLSVSYWMDQPAVITPHRTHFVEVYTYDGPR